MEQNPIHESREQTNGCQWGMGRGMDTMGEGEEERQGKRQAKNKSGQKLKYKEVINFYFNLGQVTAIRIPGVLSAQRVNSSKFTLHEAMPTSGITPAIAVNLVQECWLKSSEKL